MGPEARGLEGAPESGNRVLPAAAAAAALAVLAFEIAHPVSEVAPTGRASLETVIALCSLAAAWLVRGQFAYSRRLRDLLLFGALLTLGLAHCAAYALPAALGLPAGSGWAASGLWGELLIATLFAAYALAPAERLVCGDRRACAVLAGVGVIGVAAAELAGWLLRPVLLSGTQPTAATEPVLRRPAALALVIVATAVFSFAAVAVARARRSDRDSVRALVAAAVVLMAGARLHYLALPTTASQLIAPRDGLRLVASALLLLAAVRQDRKVPMMAARAAAAAERRRVARDLHDGLAQDLAFIAAYGPRIADAVGEGHAVVVAAKRALAVSRGTISELCDHADESAREALEAVASELAHRFETAITVDVDVDHELAAEDVDHVTGIAREAITNACRHGAARHVTVSMRTTARGMSLRVIDDGCGIVSPRAAAARPSFGLRMMRQRARALGGRMTILPRERGGTEVEIRLP